MYLSAMNSSLSCSSSPSITPRNRSCSFSPPRIEQHGFLVLVRNKKSFIQKRRIRGTSLCMERFGFSANFVPGSSNLVVSCYRESGSSDNEEKIEIAGGVSTAEEGIAVSNEGKFSSSVGDPVLRSYLPDSAKMSVGDQGFYLLAFVACTTCVAFTSFVVAAIPTFYAIGRAATSLSKLADTACAELPSTMAAIRLSGMEISDLTLELSDLSQEIADGVNKSSQAVQAAEAGIRQIGALARDRTMSMASNPINSIQPVVAGAAEKTSRAVGHAKRTLLNIISRGEFSSDDEENATDRLDV